MGLRSALTEASSCAPHGRTESSVNNPGHAQRYITEEIAAGRLRRVPHQAPVHWSSIGLTPFRLIINLSAPSGSSVNDGISPSLTTLTYPRVDDAVNLIRSAGCGAKLDLKAAYRHVPVNPDDQSLLAIQWGGATYLDTALPFGLKSSPLWRMGCLGA